MGKKEAKYRVLRCSSKVVDDTKLISLLQEGYKIVSAVAVSATEVASEMPYIQYVLEKKDED